jgi:hypothetical protein
MTVKRFQLIRHPHGVIAGEGTKVPARPRAAIIDIDNHHVLEVTAT